MKNGGNSFCILFFLHESLILLLPRAEYIDFLGLLWYTLYRLGRPREFLLRLSGLALLLLHSLRSLCARILSVAGPGALMSLVENLGITTTFRVGDSPTDSVITSSRFFNVSWITQRSHDVIGSSLTGRPNFTTCLAVASANLSRLIVLRLRYPQESIFNLGSFLGSLNARFTRYSKARMQSP